MTKAPKSSSSALKKERPRVGFLAHADRTAERLGKYSHWDLALPQKLAKTQNRGREGFSKPRFVSMC